jgi:predicted exporter
MGAPEARYMVVLSAADADTALQMAEQAAPKLDQLVADGVIGSYDNPARFLPSTQTQRARQAALPEPDVLRQRLIEAQADSPLAASALEPFIADVTAARGQPLLERAALGSSGLGLLVDSLLVQRAGGWSVLLPLHPPTENSAGEFTEINGAAVQAVLAGTEAHFIDMKTELDTLYNDYLGGAITLSLAGVCVIVLLLGATLRSPRRLASVLLPLVLAIVFVIAGLQLAGETLHLLHLVGLLLVVAVGSNFGLFFDRAEGQADLEPPTVAAMGVANLTTTLGFGVLGFSTVPVLHAMGVTVGPGAVLVLLLAAMFKR